MALRRRKRPSPMIPTPRSDSVPELGGYPLSYEHVSELVAERGVQVDASCIWRWVQAYAPELNKRCRPHLKPTNKSYRIDETYINVRGEDKYLYRALDSAGQTIDFLLTAKRDTAAAKRFLRRAMDASGNPMPRVMNVDKNPAYPAAAEKAESGLFQRFHRRDVGWRMRPKARCKTAATTVESMNL